MPMNVPAKAMVLAAGLGLRMRPITDRIPKPLVEVDGCPLIDRILDQLAKAGVEEAVVNLHYKGDQLRRHLARQHRPRLTFSEEPALLETGGGVRRALPLLGPDPFFVINGDVMWLDGVTPTLHRLAAAWNDAEMDALLLMVSTPSAIGYEGPGDFVLDPLGRARRRLGHEIAPFLFGGLQILHPRLFEGEEEGAFSLNRLYDKAQEAGRLFGLRHDGVWFHIGTPESILETEEWLNPTRLDLWPRP